MERFMFLCAIFVLFHQTLHGCDPGWQGDNCDIPCQDGWMHNPTNGACYLIVLATGVDFDWATWECLRYKNARLANIENREEQTFLMNYMSSLDLTGSEHDALWVAGTDVLEEGNWTWYLYNEPWSPQIKWREGQPDNHGKFQHCAALLGNAGNLGELDDLGCLNRDLKGYVCKATPVTAECANGWYHDMRTNICYLFSNEQKSWQDAQEFCKMNYQANLASITSKDEEEFLKAIAYYGVTLPYIWIGANDIEEEGTWQWSDQSMWWTGITWAPGQPDNQTTSYNCAMINTYSLNLYVVDCSGAFPFICKTTTHTAENNTKAAAIAYSDASATVAEGSTGTLLTVSATSGLTTVTNTVVFTVGSTSDGLAWLAVAPASTNSTDCVISLANAQVIDYDDPNLPADKTYVARVTAQEKDASDADVGGATTYTVTFTITDVLEVTGLTVSIMENLAGGATVVTVGTDAGSGTYTFAIASQTPDSGWFAIASSTGVITVADGQTVNFEDTNLSNHTYKVVVVATASDNSASATGTVVITITDTDDFVTGLTASVPHGTTTGMIITRITTTPADAAVSLVSQTGNLGWFSLSNKAISVAPDKTIDSTHTNLEPGSKYLIVLTVGTGSTQGTGTVTISITTTGKPKMSCSCNTSGVSAVTTSGVSAVTTSRVSAVTTSRASARTTVTPSGSPTEKAQMTCSCDWAP